MAMAKKQCSRCQKVKPATRRYFRVTRDRISKKNPKGLRSPCRKCQREMGREYNSRKAIKERRSKYNRRYYLQKQKYWQFERVLFTCHSSSDDI